MMENGEYNIERGAVDVSFSRDERTTYNLPHVYVTHLVLDFAAVPSLEGVVEVSVGDDDFKVQLLAIDPVGKSFVVHEFETKLPMTSKDALLIRYANPDNVAVKIRVFHTYR